MADTLRRAAGAVHAMVCGVRCPKCGLGCNQGLNHGGSHTDREHSW